jgi:ferrous iron transport protein B
MWAKGSQYLKKMGGVILVASIIIWALGYYPRDIEYSVDYDQKIEQIAQSNPEAYDEIQTLVNKKNAEKQEKSYIGQIGKFIEPAMRPLGFDWKMSVSILSGVPGKEIVVSTMGVLYQAEENGSDVHENLVVRLQNDKDKDGNQIFTPLVAYTFLLFILLYFPCIATIIAINKEAGHWKWGLFTIFYTTSLAWIISFLVYQTGTLILNL